MTLFAVDFDGTALRRAVLLAALAECPDHGYSLKTRLRRDYGAAIVERSVYRLLSTLEDEGLIKHTWLTPDAGPARRVFEVTETGLDALAAYRRPVEALRQALGVWLDRAEAALVADARTSFTRRLRRRR